MEQWVDHLIIKSICNKKRRKINERVLASLKEDHFTNEFYKHAFRRLNSYYAKKGRILTWKELIVDTTLPLEVRRRLRAREVKRKKLKKHDSSIGLPSNFEEYSVLIDSLIDDAKQVNLIEIQNYLTDKLGKEDLDSNELEKIFDGMFVTIDKIKTLKSQTGSIFKLNKKNIKDTLTEFQSKLKNHFFIPTGFRDFDSINIGIPRDSYLLISAKSSAGKSTLSLQLAINMKNAGARVCFVPLEMSKEQMLLRMASNLLSIEISTLIKNFGKYKKKIIKKLSKFVQSNDSPECLEFYVPEPEHTLVDVLTALKTSNYDVVYIDYISLLAPLDNDDQKSLNMASRYAKAYATNNQTIIALLAQLDEDTNRVRYARALTENASNSFVWNETAEEINELGYITVRQPKARNQNPTPFKLKTELKYFKMSNHVEEGYDDYDDDNDDDNDGDIPNEDDI